MIKTEKEKLELLALKIRIGVLEQMKARGFGHVGGSLSAAELLAVLYGRKMRYDAKDPQWPERDKFVCSKGHAGPVVYAALALSGFFPYDTLKTLNQPGTILPSHCDHLKTPGIDMTTGSLGQGASLAVGIALGDQLKGRSGHTYLLLGDGELNEGQVWEAAMFAAAKRITNITFLIDWNKRQLDGPVSDILEPFNIEEKFRAFGWNVIEIYGHSFDEIDAAFKAAAEFKGKPTAIIAKTVKGKGVSFMEDQCSWHGTAPNAEQYEQAMNELKAQLAELEA